MSVSSTFVLDVFRAVDDNPCAKSTHAEPTLHIALVGNTGVGKSTLVNALIGHAVAEVSNDVRPCTTRAVPYKMAEGGTKYCIWDTRGLNEASEGTPMRMLKLLRIVPDAERELKKLLRGNDPKFNLVLLIIDAKKIRVGVHWKNYDLIYAGMCGGGLDVAVVVTQMEERDLRAGSGWRKTCESAAKGIAERFPEERLMVAVPSFEGLSDPRAKECKDRIMKLISDNVRRRW